MASKNNSKDQYEEVFIENGEFGEIADVVDVSGTCEIGIESTRYHRLTACS